MLSSPAESLIETAADRSDPTAIATALIRSAGWDDATVTRYEVVPGANPDLSQVFRVYTDAKYERTAPCSMIVKVPVEVRAQRIREANEGAYVREATIFEILKDLQGTNLPHVHASAIHEESKTYAMLFEDLGEPIGRGEWTLDLTSRALVDLAGLHSVHWGDDALIDYWWMRSSLRADIFNQDPELFGPTWDNLRASPEAHVREVDELVRTADYLGTHLAEVLDELERRPKTLSHGDLHQGNLMMRRHSDGAGTPVIIDWQAAVYGGSTSDIAKLLATAPDAAIVEKNEAELLGTYHQALTREIRDRYSEEQLARDYRLALLATLGNYVISATTEPKPPELGRAPNRSLRSVARLVELSKPLRKLE